MHTVAGLYSCLLCICMHTEVEDPHKYCIVWQLLNEFTNFMAVPRNSGHTLSYQREYEPENTNHYF